MQASTIYGFWFQYFCFVGYEKVLRWILSNGGSFNAYMFHGGTNFGFMAGANEGLGATNEGNKNPYQPDVTSYGMFQCCINNILPT